MKNKIPKEYICPIGKEIMKNPVTFLVDNTIYDKENLFNECGHDGYCLAV